MVDVFPFAENVRTGRVTLTLANRGQISSHKGRQHSKKSRVIERWIVRHGEQHSSGKVFVEYRFRPLGRDAELTRFGIIPFHAVGFVFFVPTDYRTMARHSRAANFA
jgi:hypothetical protein